MASDESARLDLAELILIADDLAHRRDEIRNDCRRVVQRAMSRSRVSERDQRRWDLTPSDAQAVHEDIAQRREILQTEVEAEWRELDCAMDELLSRARATSVAFSTNAELRFDSYERAVRHLVQRARVRSE